MSAAGCASLRLAVVSPSVDRRHGTERAVAELIGRLARVYKCEVHLFAQSVADVEVIPAASVRGASFSNAVIYWHRVANVPGPQLFRFSVWLLLNRLHRSGASFDLVVSPGLNCFDADIVIVHVLFHQLAKVARNPTSDVIAKLSFFRTLHRRTYYSLLGALERRIYANRRVALAAVSHRTASLIEKYFHREDVRVITNGVDSEFFAPSSRLARRERSRAEFRLQPSDFVLLLIGNDWVTKGIHTVFKALALLKSVPVRLMVVGSDVLEPYAAAAAKMGVLDRCIWQPPSVDILDCYAIADAYVSPSREDSFGLPVLEAMACGLPAITSAAAGVSELLKDGVNGFVLQDSQDAETMARHVARLCKDSSLRMAVGEAAALAAREWTWDRNAAAVWRLLSDVVSRKATGGK